MKKIYIACLLFLTLTSVAYKPNYEIVIYNYFALDSLGKEIGGYPVLCAFSKGNWYHFPHEKPKNCNIYQEKGYKVEEQESIDVLNHFLDIKNLERLTEIYQNFKENKYPKANIYSRDSFGFFRVECYRNRQLTHTYLFPYLENLPACEESYYEPVDKLWSVMWGK